MNIGWADPSALKASFGTPSFSENVLQFIMTSFCEKPFEPVANDGTLYLGNQIPFELLRPKVGLGSKVDVDFFGHALVSFSAQREITGRDQSELKQNVS